LTKRNKHTDRLNVQEQGKHDCMLSEIGFFKDNLAKKGANIREISAFVWSKEICYASKI